MKTKKTVLKPEDAAAVKRAAKVIASLNKKAYTWLNKIDAIPHSNKKEWANELAKCHAWTNAIEKETRTVHFVLEFRFA